MSEIFETKEWSDLIQKARERKREEEEKERRAKERLEHSLLTPEEEKAIEEKVDREFAEEQAIEEEQEKPIKVIHEIRIKVEKPKSEKEAKENE